VVLLRYASASLNGRVACSGAGRSWTPDNNAMNQTNRGVTGSRSGRPSGEPVLAEVGRPFILSLDVAGYCGVMRLQAEGAVR
jgi:hypothetical protein